MVSDELDQSITSNDRSDPMRREVTQAKAELQTLQEMVKSKTPEEIEKAVLPEKQEPVPIIHTFGPGIYTREFSAPAGTFIMGLHHKYSHLNMFLRGKMLLFAANGSLRYLEAPMIVTTGPGRKTFVVVEAVTWLNFFPSNDEMKLDALEEMFLELTQTWYDFNRTGSSDEDYGFYDMLEEIGMTKEQMDNETCDDEDEVSLPYGSYKCGVHQSPIHGRGIRATADIYPEELIGSVRLNGKRTLFERYLNHSDRPNAYCSGAGDDIHLFAYEHISGSSGGTLGGEILVDYRKLRGL